MGKEYSWKSRRDKKVFLALENGVVFEGYSIGAEKDIEGEVVFNTGMSGYQEILTDPSYAGQIVTMTYPEIGSTGINEDDNESHDYFLNGFILHSYNEASNWRSEVSLNQKLIQKNIPCIAGVDTRALTSLLRVEGTLKGYIHCSKNDISTNNAIEKAKQWSGLDNQDYASKVSCNQPWKWKDQATLTWGIANDLPKAEFKVVAYDFGIKWNILRSLRIAGFDVTAVPCSTPPENLLKYKPDGIFFSNGPGDPAAVTYAIKAAKKLIGTVPIMGICLGHQILSLACGAKTKRLKFGHHGCNHPVKNLLTNKIEITSQNHNFAVDKNSILSTDLDITHINLNDNTVEGIRHKNEPVFAVQYHPEASPGPHDPSYLFNEFKKLITDS